MQAKQEVEKALTKMQANLWLFDFNTEEKAAILTFLVQ